METTLKKIRRKKGLTQVQVAEKAGITERNYQRIESGEQQPKVMTAMLIAQSLNIENIEDIFPLRRQSEKELSNSKTLHQNDSTEECQEQ